ncbi:Glycosyltransferase involved in cell wall bisynthesis [Candidatus Electrothrix aarhusensis]|uniref:Glycosyltransferase involved in cell wall bisynthesis n=1 Tax=Candidatus Electrothrix aarhusensis TaxID=1859131 RepID=A0A3S3QL09_9BACT|nr:Glycosyltransferase involved in cell wall bisynthesis [Candidatus Electrothrix aarhusensis]
MNTVIVIPVYNEAEVVGQVIKDVRAHGFPHIIVVDDGSTDESWCVASAHDVLALRLKVNRGKGAAVKTGIMAANLLNADVIVTMDGDGQHDPADIKPLITPILEGKNDVVLGSRLLHREDMPFIKVIANNVGNFFTWLFYGLLVSDSQSGFRAYSRYAALIIDTKADKYEYDSKVIREIKNNRLRFTEVPVQTLYTSYSKGKKNKQGFINGLVTLYRMVWKLIA